MQVLSRARQFVPGPQVTGAHLPPGRAHQRCRVTVAASIPDYHRLAPSAAERTEPVAGGCCGPGEPASAPGSTRNRSCTRVCTEFCGFHSIDSHKSMTSPRMFSFIPFEVDCGSGTRPLGSRSVPPTTWRRSTWTTKLRRPPFATALSGGNRATHFRTAKNAWRSPLSSPDWSASGIASSALPVQCWPSHLPPGRPCS